MKLKDCVNVYTNKKNKQMKFEIKKRVLKENNMNVKDLMKMDIPLVNKLKKFEDM